MTIGRVTCDDAGTAVQPQTISDKSVSPFPTADLYMKLQFFVQSMAPGRPDELLSMKSDFWSFVELP